MEELTFPPLSGASFFEWRCPCLPIEIEPISTLLKRLHHPQYELPNTSELLSQASFAQLFIGWHNNGLAIAVEVDQPYHKSFYPNVTKGDSVELFIDTRDNKQSRYPTRYCHHLFLLPEAVEGHKTGEITQFRGEESRPYCNADQIYTQSQLHKDSYSLLFLIPSSCLMGYDPSTFDRIGFSYRINRYGGQPQLYSNVKEEGSVEQQPFLWSSLLLQPSTEVDQ